MNAFDFEKMNGFPNFWAWGFEDNMLQYRAISSKLIIDRSNFYPIYNKNFILLHDGLSRVVNKNEFDRYIRETKEGIHSIQRLSFHVNKNTGFVDVNHFITENNPRSNDNQNFDLRKGSQPFKITNQNQGRGRNAPMKMFF